MRSYTIEAWADLHGFTRAYFYILEKRGQAPETYRVGRSRRVSEDANANWLRQREAASRERVAA